VIAVRDAVEKLLARAEAEADLKGDGNTRGSDFGKAALAKILRGGRTIGNMRGGAELARPFPGRRIQLFSSGARLSGKRCTA
jgi:hypothetical protein